MAGDDPVSKQVLERWDRADKALLEDRRNYWLNRAYFEGYQWVRWDPNQRLVQSTVPTSTYENSRMRVTVNLVQPRVSALIGRMCQRDLAFEGKPSDTDDASVTRSRNAEAILESRRQDLQWESVREYNCLNTIFGGTGALMLEWDNTAGLPVTNRDNSAESDPLPAEDEGITKDMPTNPLNDLWRTGSGQYVGQGEVKITPLSIAEFSLEPGVRHWTESRWVVACTAVPPEQVKEKFNLGFTPKADSMEGTSPLRHQLTQAAVWTPRPELTAVYVMYERPNRACPSGRHAVVVNDQTIVDENWPFPFDQLNIYPFRALKRSGVWTGITMMTAARPIQMLYNIVRSTLAEHGKLASNARLMVPKGALDDAIKLSDEPGEIVEYYADQGAPVPQYLMPPQLPRWLTQEASNLEEEMDEIMSSSDISRGQLPGDRTSGLAVSIAAEKNDTPLGPMARDQADGWGYIGSLCLQIYARKANEKRTAIVISPHGVPSKLEWDGNQIGDQWRVEVPLDNVMPTSKMATQAMLVNLAQVFPQLFQQLDPVTLTTMLDFPGSKAITDGVDADLSKAIYENERMAASQVEVPATFDDHAKHMSQHNRFRKSTEFASLDQDIKDLFQAHIDAHQQLILEEAVHTATVNSANPGFGAIPQANEPLGSAMPPTKEEQQVFQLNPNSGAPSRFVA